MSGVLGVLLGCILPGEDCLSGDDGTIKAITNRGTDSSNKVAFDNGNTIAFDDGSEIGW